MSLKSFTTKHTKGTKIFRDRICRTIAWEADILQMCRCFIFVVFVPFVVRL